MSIESLKALAEVGFNGDMQLGLIANSLLNVVGTNGAQRRSALQVIARDVELLSVADIKRRKLIQKPADTTNVTKVSQETVAASKPLKLSAKAKTTKVAKPKSAKASASKVSKSNGKSETASASASA